MACDPNELRHVPLFALLDEEEAAVLAGQVEMKKFAPRQRIYKIGEPGGQAYVMMSGRAYGPVATTSPEASNGFAPLEWMTYRWWTTVAPADTIALTGQYFVADSSMERLTAVTLTAGPSTTCTRSIRVKTWGYSSR